MLQQLRARTAGGQRRQGIRENRSRRPERGQSAAAVLTLLLALGPAALPARAATPSPADWRDVVIYQVITDRFANGNPANDAVEGQYDPADGAKTHGGDFAGLTGKLDYLQNLGVGAVWISPVVLNANAEYHGYAARDFYTIAPHFGTLAELQALSAALHARGMYLVLDVVVNHMGDLIDSGNSSYPAYRYPSTYTLRWKNVAKQHAPPFNDLAKFHAHGGIDNYVDPNQLVGELFSLDDLKTEDATVRQQLGLAARWIILNTDADGFRLDTVKHIEMGFWSTWTPEVRAYADSLGKDRFFFFGEVFDGDDAKNGSYTGTVGGGPYKLDSVLYYPMYFTLKDVFLNDVAPDQIPARAAQLGAYDATSRERLVTFLDNHDNSRFLRAGPGPTVQDESRLRAALGMLLTGRGVPCLYYGTEQEFDGGGDPWCREDMWDGAWDFGPSEGDNFDLVHPLFLYTRRLLEIRARHEALRRGDVTERYAETSGPGLYVFDRRTDADTVLVAIQTANAPASRAQATPWPAGTVLVDALDGGFAVTTGAGGAIALAVPARGVRVLESAAAAGAAAAALRVETAFPGHDQAIQDRHAPLRVTFDGEVDPGALAGAFHITPAVAGVWQVAGRLARFLPYDPWPAATSFAWSLDAGLADRGGRELGVRFDATFRTGGTTAGVTVPAGFVADRIARQGLAAPEAILNATALGPDRMLVSDTALDRLFTLTPGGDLGHWLGDSRWTKVEGLALSPSGGVSALDETGLYAIGADRMTVPLLPGSAATQTGAGAWGTGGFPVSFHLGDPTGDRIARVGGSGTLETFVGGIAGAEGLAFGPGGAWGEDLYVADADLTSLGSPANGPGRIVRIGPGGSVTTVAGGTPLLAGVSALAFDTQGRFGGDLFAADILGERILRVTPAGAVSVFASGFGNLSGSQCLAFGPDGALYVADPGSGQPFSDSGAPTSPQVVRIAPATLVTGVAPAAIAATLELAAGPNPARESVVLRYAVPAGAVARVSVYDVGGRRLREFRPRAAAGSVRWDLAADDGRPVGAGVFFARLDAGGISVTRRFAVTR
jgi:glycosidase